MNFFSSQKCKKFFTYKSTSLDVKGISAMLGEEGSKFNIGVGEIEISPEYVRVSEKLMQLDILQYSICENINKLEKGNPNRQTLIEEHIQICQEMMLIAIKPEKYDNPSYQAADDIGKSNHKKGMPQSVGVEKKIYKIMIDTFTLNELKEACFLLAIDYEDLPGETKSGKVLEIIGFLKRRNQLDILKEKIINLRPNISFDD